MEKEDGDLGEVGRRASSLHYGVNGLCERIEIGLEGIDMKAVIDKNTCTACGLCVSTCPEVFDLDGDVATVKVQPVPAAAEATCRQAAEECPVNAILIEE